MKRIISLFLLLVPVAAMAQKPQASDRTLAGEERAGFMIVINGDLDAVRAEWVDFWKEMGKQKKQRGYYTISELGWNGLSAREVEGYSMVESQGTAQTEVWLAIEAAAMGPGLDKPTLMMQVLEDFEFQYYRNELKKLVAEAEQAESYLSKETYRSEKESERLESALVKNQRQHEKLEERLAQNEQEKQEMELALQQQAALRAQMQKDLVIIQERLNYLRNKLANYTGNQDPSLPQ